MYYYTNKYDMRYSAFKAVDFTDKRFAEDDGVSVQEDMLFSPHFNANSLSVGRFYGKLFPPKTATEAACFYFSTGRIAYLPPVQRQTHLRVQCGLNQGIVDSAFSINHLMYQSVCT
jgi:hypothetical protein